MMREALSYFPYTSLVIAGQVMMFATFGMIIWGVFRSRSKSYYERASRIPLDEEGTSHE
jgi:cbb3-type cytochrome oxidase subunit 3